MKNNLFIRVDSSSEIGIGHMMRCLTLAQELKNNFDKIIFLTQKDSGDFIGTIMKNKFEVIFISTTNNDPDIIKNLIITYSENKNFLLIDHYDIDSNFESSLKNIVVLVIIQQVQSTQEKLLVFL
jgi:spore coat polysaccharide biosynthesis predicted glycosyltransferase SpsG